MKIIIRNRNKKIEVNNITSKEEMVWIDPEKYTQITTDAGTMAMEFMKKHPQIHEVKFSVLPQMDEEEDEEQFYASEDDCQKPDRQVVIKNEEKLREDMASMSDITTLYTLDEIRETLKNYEDVGDGTAFGFSVCRDADESRRCFGFYQNSYQNAEYEYYGLDKF